MGSGKSVIGHLLAKKANIPFLDLDEYAQQKEGESISEIIKTKGEMYFRRQESVYFNELMDSKEAFVLSLGGGTPVYAGNHNRLKDGNVESFYLKASIPVLVERLSSEKEHRPLISSLEGIELEEFIGKHLLERQEFYFSAKHVISVDAKSVEEIVGEINSILSAD
ncbi:shikimate kinase [Flavobacterium sp. SE-s28]|uniref:Shikimate kinase n=2 Tax=Flavobacterium silvaticum TaxID=1852020 RepID=A0A972FM31_9FLAO|nr:shikimate kinase [Flavobacterium silvaticum]